MTGSISIHGRSVRIAACSKCHAPIIWCITKKNHRPQPVDAEPDPHGNIEILDEWAPGKYGVAPVSNVVDLAQLGLDLGGEPRELRMPHHATCPFADQFRS